MNIANKILYDAVLSAVPIMLAVLGGIFAYRANVLNIALEGMMLLATFFICFFTISTGSYWIALFLAIIISVAAGLIFSFFGITLKGNVIIVGLAINLFASAITAFILQVIGKSNLVIHDNFFSSQHINIPLINRIPIIGSILSGHTILTYLSYASILFMWILMYRTRFGVYVRVVGENEDAARAVGIHTTAIKYWAITIGAITSALGGISLAMDELGGLFTKDMTAGRGFIAIAAIFCGRGKPGPSALYAMVFGLARSLSLNLSIYAGSIARLFNAIPYVVIVIVLLGASIVKNRNNHQRGFLNE